MLELFFGDLWLVDFDYLSRWLSFPRCQLRTLGIHITSGCSAVDTVTVETAHYLNILKPIFATSQTLTSVTLHPIGVQRYEAETQNYKNCLTAFFQALTLAERCPVEQLVIHNFNYDVRPNLHEMDKAIGALIPKPSALRSLEVSGFGFPDMWNL